MSHRSLLVMALGAAALAGVSSIPAAAQTNERVYEDLSFRFVTPGARAVGMGRSFIGLADDATAADSNPAGLANLQERELSFELTATSIKHHRFVGVAGADVQPFGDRVASLSFVSAVFPVKAVTLAPFRNVAQHYRETFDVPGRVIPANTVPGQRAFSEDGTFGHIGIDSETYGLGLSYVASTKVAVGASFALNVLDVDVSARSGDVSLPKNGSDTVDGSLRPKVVVGVLAKLWPELWVGAAYHAKVTHAIDTRLFGCFANNLAPFTLCPHSRSEQRQVNLTGEVRRLDYVIPDRTIVGFSAQPHPALVVVSDLQHVRYSSRITDRFQIVDFINPADGIGRDDFSIRDVLEFHAGGELRLRTNRQVFAIRGGVFNDPEHQLRFTPRPETPPHENLEFRFNRVPDRTDWGGTLGFGITFQNVWQFDAAFSGIRSARDLTFSLVRRLP